MTINLHGDGLVLKYTHRYLNNLLKEKNYPDIFITTFGPNFNQTTNFIYPGKILETKVVNIALSNSLIESDFASQTSFIIDSCKKSDSCNIDISIINKENNMFKIISSIKTDKGYIKDLIDEDRKQLFDLLYQNKVVDSQSFVNDLVLDNSSMIFFIPSVIYLDPKNTGRSIFSSRERLEQTVKQVKSIKDKVPNSKIILLEMSELTLDDIESLVDTVDKIVLYTRDPIIQNYAHNDSNKNKAEVGVLQHITPFFKDKPFSHAFKFGGRYWLSDEFKIEDVITDKIGFRINESAKWDNGQIVRTMLPELYSISKSTFELFTHLLNYMQWMMERYYLDNERLVLMMCEQNNCHIKLDRLNVCGYNATLGIFRCL
jgi:hypothetical protein